MEKASPRRLRQLGFINQFTTDIRQTSGSENSTADALSRKQTLYSDFAQKCINFKDLAVAQSVDNELQNLLKNQGSPNNSFLKYLSVLGCDDQIVCDTST